MKTRKGKKILLTFVLIGALLGVQVMEMIAYAADTGTETGEPTVVCSNFSQLEEAVEQAKDGDVIGIEGGIHIRTNIDIGSSDKNIALKRMSPESYILIEVGKTTFVNVTFDGASLNSTISFLQSKYEMEANNVVFQNCTSNIGGAVSIEDGSATFTNCIFENNTAIAGGHLALKGNSNVIINQCTYTKGTAGNGGAIYVVSVNAFCSVLSSVITENSAQDAGGGLANKGQVQIQGTKLYNNYATNGGYDIANFLTGITTLMDSTEELQTLFGDEFKINGWVSDSSGVFIPDVDLSREDCLLKLDYEEIMEEPSEPTEPDDTGNDTTDPTDPGDDTDEPPTDTEDTGTDEEPSTPTEPSVPDEGEDGDQEEPTEPSQPDDSDQDATEEPSEPTAPGDPDDGQEEPATPPGDDSDEGDTQTPSNNNTSNTTTDNSVDNSDHSTHDDHSTSTTDNSKTDNSKTDNSTVTEDNSSVVNNYYYTTENPGQQNQQQTQIQTPAPQVIVVKDSSSDKDETSSTQTLDPSNNIRIEAEGADVIFEVVDGVYSISIKAEESSESVQEVQTVTTAAPVEADDGQSLNWYETIKIALLAALVVNVMRKPKTT